MSGIFYKGVLYGAGGSGGGGDPFTKTELWSQNDWDAFPNTITLSQSYQNFDYLEFETFKGDDSSYYDMHPSIFVSKEDLDAVKDGFKTGRPNVLGLYGWHPSNDFARYSVTNTTTLTKVQSYGNWGIKRVNGVKFGSGGSGGGGSSMWRIMYYDENDVFLNREYVRDGDDALFTYKSNNWAESSGGTINPSAQEDVNGDTDLYYIPAINAPVMVYKYAENKAAMPMTYTFTVSESGNYFVFADAAAHGGDATNATTSSTGTELYSELFSADSIHIQASVYACNSGDTITINMKAGDGYYDSYHIFSATIINMKNNFRNISKESSQLGENGTRTVSASTEGTKFGFAASCYQNGVTHSVTCTDTTDGKKIEYSETSAMNMSCIAINSEYSSGDTLSLTASTSTSYGYNNNFVLLLNLS